MSKSVDSRDKRVLDGVEVRENKCIWTKEKGKLQFINVESFLGKSQEEINRTIFDSIVSLKTDTDKNVRENKKNRDKLQDVREKALEILTHIEKLESALTTYIEKLESAVAVSIRLSNAIAAASLPNRTEDIDEGSKKRKMPEKVESRKKCNKRSNMINTKKSKKSE